MTERSSTRLHKPPGGGSTIGSLIFGGGNDEPSYMDDRKARRFSRPDAAGPEQNHPIIGDKSSYYGTQTAIQRERDNITLPPGAVPRDSIAATREHQQQQYVGSQTQIVRRGSQQQQQNAASGDYFANGMGNNQDNGERRTRRMYSPPGGTSSFKLG
jgi:hypothetical protein